MTKAFKNIFQKATTSDKEEIKQTIKNSLKELLNFEYKEPLPSFVRLPYVFPSITMVKFTSSSLVSISNVGFFTGSK